MLYSHLKAYDFLNNKLQKIVIKHTALRFRNKTASLDFNKNVKQPESNIYEYTLQQWYL